MAVKDSPACESQDDNEEVEFRPSLRLSRFVLEELWEEAEHNHQTINEYITDLISNEVG